MAEKRLVVVVCDLHRADRMATHKVTIDVCDQHYNILMQATEGPYECPECGRHFRSQAGLTKHLTDTHNHKPATKAAQAKRTKRKATSRRKRRLGTVTNPRKG